MVHEFLHEGMLRRFAAVRPADWLELGESAPAYRLPLVLVFHGGGGIAESFVTTLPLPNIAAQSADLDDKFIAVYLQGISLKEEAPLLEGLPPPEGGRWYGGGSWDNGGPTGHFGGDATVVRPDDVDFVYATLAILDAEYTRIWNDYWAARDGRAPVASILDVDRIYATGFSGGACFVYRLAMQLHPSAVAYPLAAIVPIAGTAAGWRHAIDGPDDGLIPGPRVQLLTDWDPAAHGAPLIHVYAIHGLADTNVGCDFDAAVLGLDVTLGSKFASGDDGGPSFFAYDYFTSTGTSVDVAEDLTRWDLFYDTTLDLWVRHTEDPVSPMVLFSAENHFAGDRITDVQKERDTPPLVSLHVRLYEGVGHSVPPFSAGQVWSFCSTRSRP